MKKILFIILVMLASIHCNKEVIQRNDLARFFREYNVTGSIMLYDNNKKAYYTNDIGRCRRGFIPASTFKIMNSLSSLETGIIKDENVVIKWNGYVYKYDTWNKDHTLQSAIKYSVVWYYQELARKIGIDAIKKYLNECNYGNNDLSAGVDKFWLEGNFRVTQEEQINFLKNLYFNTLPFSKRNIDIVKRILKNDDINSCQVYAKTGFADKVSPAIGWWIGYIENGNNVIFFATNIESYKPDDNFTKARIEITKNILKYLGYCSN